MLNRQKLVLYMVEKAGRPVRHLELTKWSFLLAHETPSRGGPCFYQFLPYRLGPFSFCLYREAGALVRDGHLVDEGKAWKIAEPAPPLVGQAGHAARDDAARLVDRFRDESPDALLDYVYRQFPWFTVNSTRRRLDQRPVAAPGVYTVGYEGCPVDGFLNRLMRAGIQRVVDVRSHPVARRYGFHRSTLERLCEKVGIQYAHLPQLGIPSGLRRGLRTLADYEGLFARYEADTLVREAAAVDKIAAMMKEKPTALMCMEADPSRCHRSRLAKAVARRTGLPVKHLGDPCETRL